MEPVFAVLIGLFFTVSVYLMMSRRIVRIMIGVAILGNAVNLLIFTAGRLVPEVPPVIPLDAMVPSLPTANPLPQALILTAIVISAIGLLFAGVSGLVSAFAGVPYLTALWAYPTILGSEVAVSTPLVFDIGVYLVVLGAFTAVMLELESRDVDRGDEGGA